MRPLPPAGLIVSCYLNSMRGCEREFIASVAHLPQVVALRVEGLANIQWARMVAPEKFIIGLVKAYRSDQPAITPGFGAASKIITAGADMVATSNFRDWLPGVGPHQGNLEITRYGISMPWRVMLDLRQSDLGWVLDHAAIRQELINGNIILATTYEQKAFDMVAEIKRVQPRAKVNLEGGIETQEEIHRAFEIGADYVTIGKGINDPPTIIRCLMAGIGVV